jgi:hypothetical protein
MISYGSLTKMAKTVAKRIIHKRDKIKYTLGYELFFKPKIN